MTAIAVALAWTVAPAAAESPTALAEEELADDGVYVAPGRDVDERELADSINKARATGLRLVVVVPNDPQPDPAAFARRVQEASDADAAIVFPPDGGLEAHVIDEFESARFRALAAARSQTNPVVAVDTFSTELLAEPTQALPPVVRQVVLLVLLLAFVLAGAVALEQVRRRSVRQEMIEQQRPPPAPAMWSRSTVGASPDDDVWPGLR